MRSILGVTAGLLALSILLPVHGSTVALKDLTPQQAAALNASQQRLATFDRALQVLDYRRAHRKISLREYKQQQQEMIGFIANEAEFENAILHKDSANAFVFSSDQLDKLR